MPNLIIFDIMKGRSVCFTSERSQLMALPSSEDPYSALGLSVIGKISVKIEQTF